jgi:AraC-like DNA-binding protein
METENQIAHHKRGYLHKDFELFHLKDKKNIQLGFHFHDFNKIIIFMSGKVTYLIEGKAYKLKPWDILLVNSNEIHKPIIDLTETYERVIIWFNPLFLTKHNYIGCNLLTCFQIAAQENFNLLRLPPDLFPELKNIFFQLEDACKSQDFGSQILKNSLFLQLVIYLNRNFLGHKSDMQNPDIKYDETIGKILQYISNNLCGDLSVDKLASVCHLSKYYLMRRFKQQTGYTMHNYILQKRLIAANTLMKEGKSVTQSCLECGFRDYSNFIRSFKRIYGVSPKKHYKILMQYDWQNSSKPKVDRQNNKKFFR